MKLHIKKKGTIKDIQNEFSGYFPYLRIEFFRFPHTDKKLSPKEEKIDPETTIDRLVKWDNDMDIVMSERMTVNDFESLMDNRAGLFTQVFRQAGRIWIETSFTDNWTLSQQNEEGKLMSIIHDADSKKQVDWDEWEVQ